MHGVRRTAVPLPTKTSMVGNKDIQVNRIASSSLWSQRRFSKRMGLFMYKPHFMPLPVVSPQDMLQMTPHTLFKLLAALNECTEWGQVGGQDSKPRPTDLIRAQYQGPKHCMTVEMYVAWSVTPP